MTELGKMLTQPLNREIAGTAPRIATLADVNQALEKRAGREDDGSPGKELAELGLDTAHTVT